MTEKRAARLLAATVALAAVLVYLRALGAPFVYDDLARTLDAARPWRHVISPRLLSELSHQIDQRLFGAWAPGHHAVSVLLHALCSTLVFHVTRALAPEGQRLRIGFIAAVLFAIHPLNSEAVAYLSARADLLCAAACLGATLAWLRWRAVGGWARAALAIGLFVLALTAKETAAMLPAVWMIAELTWDEPDRAAARRRLWTFCAPLLLVTLAAGVARVIINLRVEAGHAPRLGHVLAQSEVQWRYLALLVWPRGQTLYHGLATSAPESSTLAWFALGCLLSLGVLALWLSARAAPLGIALVWLLAFLVPGAALPLKDAMSEHRVYLASVGAMMLAAWAIAALPRAAPAAVTTLVAAALAWMTLGRVQVWRSPVALWSEAVQAAPAAWAPHYALGDALRAAGDCTRAAEAYAEAAARAPRESRPRINRGLCLATLGRADEAEAELRAALVLVPRDAAVHNDLGMLALSRGRLDEARGHFEQALAIDPGQVRAKTNLAQIPLR